MFFLPTLKHLTAAVCVHLFYQKSFYKRDQKWTLSSVYLNNAVLHYPDSPKSEIPDIVPVMFY